MRPELSVRLQEWAKRCEHVLEHALPPATARPARLHQAMRYATLGGGKRIRPCLTYAAGLALGAREEALDDAAAAVELIHAYSLVHDDLPAMDDDDLRRGKPTVHVAYDEATAILAGDALQALAFAVLARAPLSAETVLGMLQTLGDAAGAAGMVGGQAIDLDAVGHHLDEDALAEMHQRKTGALIRAAVRLGGLAANADAATLSALDDYAAALGLGFQIRDDLLDAEGEASTIGKTAGKDAADGKPTYVTLLGVNGARLRLSEQLLQMRAALARLHCDTNFLLGLAEFAAQRGH